MSNADLIQMPQHAPPTNESCQYADYGFAPATPSRAQRAHGCRPSALGSLHDKQSHGRIRSGTQMLRVRRGQVVRVAGLTPHRCGRGRE